MTVEKAAFRSLPEGAFFRRIEGGSLFQKHGDSVAYCVAGEAIGARTLAGWNHPDKGIPDMVIPVNASIVEENDG